MLRSLYICLCQGCVGTGKLRFQMHNGRKPTSIWKFPFVNYGRTDVSLISVNALQPPGNFAVFFPPDIFHYAVYVHVFCCELRTLNRTQLGAT